MLWSSYILQKLNARGNTLWTISEDVYFSARGLDSEPAERRARPCFLSPRDTCERSEAQILKQRGCCVVEDTTKVPQI